MLEVAPTPPQFVRGSASALPAQQQDEQIIKRLPRIPGGYSCHHPGCQKRCDTKKSLNKHVRSHILGSNRKHKCGRCAKGFNDRRDLNRHLSGKTKCQIRSFMAPVPVSEPTVSEGDQWDVSHFSTAVNTALPAADVSGQDQNATPDSTQSSSSMVDPTALSLFRCSTCDENFPDKATLLDHNRHSSAHARITIDET